MVAYARARTRSWFAKLWPVTAQPIKSEVVELDKSKEFIEEQRKHFLEVTKNGGFWFS